MAVKAALGIFRFLLEAAARGEPAALVTITGVTGSTARGPGTHMAVAQGGDYVGSFSGGCVEAGVVGEAQRVLATGEAEIVRLGAGSPFIDIRLPCGGGIDLLITPGPPRTQIERALRMLESRSPVVIELGRDGSLASRPADEADRTGWRAEVFLARHDPDLRLVIVGQGQEVRDLAIQASAYNAAVEVISPDRDILAGADLAQVKTTIIHQPSPAIDLRADPYTAVVTLFHDHDWELPYLAQAVASAAFFVGAMGSRATHANRLELLRSAGLEERLLDRIVGPVGLIPVARDPETLALSVLAQVVAAYRETIGFSA